MKKFLLFLVVLTVLAGGTFYLIMWAPNTFTGDKTVIISKGESFAQVIEKLDKAGVIRSKLLFKLAGKIQKSTTKIQIGKYRFKSGMSNVGILHDLAIGASIEAIVVTIPEGLPSRRIASILAKNIGIDSARFMEWVNDRGILKREGIEAPNAEGYLFPKTYKLYWQDNEDAVLQTLLAEFKKEYNAELERRTQQVDLTVHQVLTIASIVEGETRVDSERPMIAGVYLNRLRLNMPLQADPTIQFLLPGGPRPLKLSDLERESPYNTYRYRGLPPGPVNNPGMASIKAVLYPVKHKYLFFVANGEGGHTFSKNYKQHLNAVGQYKKNLEMKKLQDKSG